MAIELVPMVACDAGTLQSSTEMFTAPHFGRGRQLAQEYTIGEARSPARVSLLDLPDDVLREIVDHLRPDYHLTRDPPFKLPIYEQPRPFGSQPDSNHPDPPVPSSTAPLVSDYQHFRTTCVRTYHAVGLHDLSVRIPTIEGLAALSSAPLTVTQAIRFVVNTKACLNLDPAGVSGLISRGSLRSHQEYRMASSSFMG